MHRFAFRITLGKSHRLYNVNVPKAFEDLLASDVLFSGKVTVERTFLFHRARLNVRVLLGILFSEKLRGDIGKRNKNLEFKIFLPWRKVASKESPEWAGLVRLQNEDGSEVDCSLSQLTLSPDETEALIRFFLYYLIDISEFLRKRAARA